jgi:hypothetical protein
VACFRVFIQHLASSSLSARPFADMWTTFGCSGTADGINQVTFDESLTAVACEQELLGLDTALDELAIGHGAVVSPQLRPYPE